MHARGGPRIALHTACLVLLVACTGESPRKAPPVTPVEAGRRVYERTVGGLACADCHGVGGQPPAHADWKPAGHALEGVADRTRLWGGRFEGPGRLRGAALWCAARFQYRTHADVARAGTREPDSAAVPLAAAERDGLVAYLRSLAGEGGDGPLARVVEPDADGILELDADLDRGELLWAAACAVCHGSEAEGGLGPGLRGEDTPDPWTFVEYVRTGALGGDGPEWMPWFPADVLTDQDLADLAARWTE